MIKEVVRNGRDLEETKWYSELLKERIDVMGSNNSGLRKLSILQLILAELLYRREEYGNLTLTGLSEFYSCFYLLEDDLCNLKSVLHVIQEGIACSYRVDKLLYRRLQAIGNAGGRIDEVGEWLIRFYSSVNQEFKWDEFDRISIGETEPWTFFENLYLIHSGLKEVNVEVDLEQGYKSCMSFFEQLKEEVIEDLVNTDYAPHFLDINKGYLLSMILVISDELYRAYSNLLHDYRILEGESNIGYQLDVDYGVIDFAGISSDDCRFRMDDYLNETWEMDDKMYEIGKVFFNHLEHGLDKFRFLGIELKVEKSVMKLRELINAFPYDNEQAKKLLDQIEGMAEWVRTGIMKNEQYEFFEVYIDAYEKYFIEDKNGEMADLYIGFEDVFDEEFFGGFSNNYTDIVDRLTGDVDKKMMDGEYKGLFELFVGLRAMNYLHEVRDVAGQMIERMMIIMSNGYELLDSNLYMYEELPF